MHLPALVKRFRSALLKISVVTVAGLFVWYMVVMQHEEPNRVYPSGGGLEIDKGAGKGEVLAHQWMTRERVHIDGFPKGPVNTEKYPSRSQNDEFWKWAVEHDKGHLGSDIIGFPQDINHYQPSVTASEKDGSREFTINSMPHREDPSRGFTFKQHIPPKSAQRGVVTCVGGEEFLSAFVPNLVYQKDILKNKLPFHLFYVGKEEMPEGMKDMIRSLMHKFPGEVTFSDISLQVEMHGVKDLRHYRVKAFSILLSPFKETIYLDADMWVPFMSIEVLFSDEDYLSTGAGFFHDRFHPNEGIVQWQRFWLWGFIGNKCDGDKDFCMNNCLMLRGMCAHDAHSVLFVVKTDWESVDFLHWVTYLVLLNHKDSHLHRVAYRWTHGDKETFWLARERAGLKYKFFEKIASYVGPLKDGDCLVKGATPLTMYKNEPMGINRCASCYERYVDGFTHMSGIAPQPYVDGESFAALQCDAQGPRKLGPELLEALQRAKRLLVQYKDSIASQFRNPVSRMFSKVVAFLGS
eukprot:Nk52_evm5s1763 gene=Nk52_evmTU5s1763